MDLEMVLNELSLRTPAPDIPTARQWMSNLIRTLREATSRDVKRELRAHININDIELVSGYPVSCWRNDREVDEVERGFFRLLQTKYPVCKDAAEEIESNFYLSEVWHQGEKTIGLRFAWASDALAVSLLSEPRWDCNHLLLKLEQLDDDEKFTDIKRVHASRPIHVKEHADWIKERIRTGVHDGSDMWNRRDELFPHLEFCDRVCEQMQELSSGDPILKKVKKQLFELEESSKNWTSGSKLDSLLGKPSTQGEGTRKQYKKEHTFRCPDGVDRIFSLHLRITESWRLHYSTELGPGRIIVGHIGPHLSTKKYPT